MASGKSEKTYAFSIDCSPLCMIENQNFSAAYHSTWKDVPKCLSNWKLDFGTGIVEFIASWDSVANNVINDYEIDKLCQKTKNKKELTQILENSKTGEEVESRLRITLRGGKEALSYPDDLLKMYLMNVFLALNLSAPGCAPMVTTFSNRRRRKEDLKLSESNWFGIWDLVWPPIQAIPLEQVVNWLTHVGFGKSQLAETPVHRLLVALLYVSGDEMWSPVHILILTQALESVIESPVERITSTLRQRLYALLGTPKDSSVIKKQITKFYELRSQIAHGNYPFIHPLANELVDSRIDEAHEKLFKNIEFGVAMLVSVAQKLMLHGWRAITFEEQVRGINF
jgi:hypothetical protein